MQRKSRFSFGSKYIRSDSRNFNNDNKSDLQNYGQNMKALNNQQDLEFGSQSQDTEILEHYYYQNTINLTDSQEDELQIEKTIQRERILQIQKYSEGSFITLEIAFSSEVIQPLLSVGDKYLFDGKYFTNLQTNEIKQAEQDGYAYKIQLGRVSQTTQNHHIMFPQTNKTVSRNQLSILSRDQKFYVMCTASLNPTIFYLDESPWRLTPGTVLELGSSLIKILIEHVNNEGYDPNSDKHVQQLEYNNVEHTIRRNKGYRTLEEVEKYLENSSQTEYKNQFKNKFGKAQIQLKFIEAFYKNGKSKISMFNGRGKNVNGTTEIISCDPAKNYEYIIGKAPDCDYCIQDSLLREKHLKIMYSPQTGWNAVDLKTTTEQYSQTGILIKTYKKFQNQECSSSMLLVNGMTIGVLGTGIKILINK